MVFALIVFIPSNYAIAMETVDKEEQNRLLFIENVVASISNSGNSITFSAAIVCNSYASSCSITAKLERRPIGGSKWSVVDSVSNSGSTDCTAYKTVTGTTGYEYRTRGDGVANSSYSPHYETAYAYSVIITL